MRPWRGLLWEGVGRRPLSSSFCPTDYMAHLVEVQHERGASGGQTFHSLLTASLPARRGTCPLPAAPWLFPGRCLPLTASCAPEGGLGGGLACWGLQPVAVLFPCRQHGGIKAQEQPRAACGPGEGLGRDAGAGARPRGRPGQHAPAGMGSVARPCWHTPLGGGVDPGPHTAGPTRRPLC